MLESRWEAYNSDFDATSVVLTSQGRLWVSCLYPTCHKFLPLDAKCFARLNVCKFGPYNLAVLCSACFIFGNILFSSTQ